MPSAVCSIGHRVEIFDKVVTLYLCAKAAAVQAQEPSVVKPVIIRAPVVHNGGFPWNIRDEWSPNW